VGAPSLADGVTPSDEARRIREAEVARRIRTATHNSCVLKRYCREREFYHDKSAERPDLCVAFSGGGLRSTYYAIGALAALRERLDRRVDVLAGASGGSWAVGWLYAQLAEPARNDRWQELFGDADSLPCGDRVGSTPEMRRLEERGHLLEHRHYAGMLVSSLALAPMQIAFNVVPFRMRPNLSPAPWFYEHRLQSTFLGGRRLTMPDLRRIATASPGGLPLPVITAAIQWDTGLGKYKTKVTDTVFEFTPDTCGSDMAAPRPYTTASCPRSLASVLEISGSAPDSAVIPGTSHRLLASLMNVDTGQYIDNDAVSPWLREICQWLPFPLYLLRGWGCPPDSLAPTAARLDLTDGGHSENLAVLPLVRRLCRRIIVVDAEHDPTYQFESYRALKRVVAGEVGATITMEEIEDDPDAPFSEGLAAARSPKGRVLRGKISGFPVLKNSPQYCPHGESGDEPCTREDERCAGVPSGPDAVGATEADVRDATIDLAYVKLALGEPVESFGPAVAEYYVQNQKECHTSRLIDDQGYFMSCGFPQQETTDLTYEPLQVCAYRQLGFETMRRALQRLEW
jgi:hypothetical protein